MPVWFTEIVHKHFGWFLMILMLMIWFGTWRIRRRKERNSLIESAKTGSDENQKLEEKNL